MQASSSQLDVVAAEVARIVADLKTDLPRVKASSSDTATPGSTTAAPASTAAAAGARANPVSARQPGSAARTAGAIAGTPRSGNPAVTPWSKSPAASSPTTSRRMAHHRRFPHRAPVAAQVPTRARRIRTSSSAQYRSARCHSRPRPIPMQCGSPVRWPPPSTPCSADIPRLHGIEITELAGGPSNRAREGPASAAGEGIHLRRVMKGRLREDR